MKKGGIVNKKGGIVSKEGEIRAETRIMWSAGEDVRARRESGCGRWFNVGVVVRERSVGCGLVWVLRYLGLIECGCCVKESEGVWEINGIMWVLWKGYVGKGLVWILLNG